MTEEEAVLTIRHELLDPGGFLLRLQHKAGLDEVAVKRLEAAIDHLTLIYQEREQVPKILAAAFIDLTPWFERCLGFYSQEEQDRIMDVRDRLVEMASRMFEP